jgi:hypothetical protein
MLAQRAHHVHLHPGLINPDSAKIVRFTVANLEICKSNLALPDDLPVAATQVHASARRQ